VKKLLNKRHPARQGSRLSAAQLAVGELMIRAIRKYSESHWCAGWSGDIEHRLWDEVILRKEDEYELARARLHELAGRAGWRRPRTRSVFAEGLKLLADLFGVWVYYAKKKGETAIPISRWLSMHAKWTKREIENRLSYHRIWELAHFELRYHKKAVPPMPKFELPTVSSRK